MNNNDQTVLNWSEMIVVFNSLIRNIENLRELIASDSLDDDDLYDVEEELNDYVILFAVLRKRYAGIEIKGDLTASFIKKIRDIC